MPVDTSKVRTVAVVGHASSGKTSLLDAALFIAKAVDKHGRVANGTSEADVPAELRDQFHKAHESLEEAAAEQDDKLLEEFLGGQALTVEEITKGTHVGVARGTTVPIYCGGPEKEVGVRQLPEGVAA